MAIEALNGVTDQDLFDNANADEAPADAVVEVADEPVDEGAQPRDEAGRFAARSEEDPAENTPAAATAPPASAPVDDNAAMVPSWRVREINEEKRALAEKLAALEAEKPRWQQPAAAQQQPAPPAVKAEAPDPILDPAGYREFIRNELREERLNERREDSLAAAHGKYKEEFEEAYAAAQKQVDPVLKMRMQQSRDPGETLIQWHREQKTRAEVGNDPNAYFDKRLDAYLADPANQAKMLERIRGGAQQPQQPGQPRQAPPVNLPPSLTKATNAAAVTPADDNDVSNEGLWRHANA